MVRTSFMGRLASCRFTGASTRCEYFSTMLSLAAPAGADGKGWYQCPVVWFIGTPNFQHGRG